MDAYVYQVPMCLTLNAIIAADSIRRKTQLDKLELGGLLLYNESCITNFDLIDSENTPIGYKRPKCFDDETECYPFHSHVDSSPPSPNDLLIVARKMVHIIYKRKYLSNVSEYLITSDSIYNFAPNPDLVKTLDSLDQDIKAPFLYIIYWSAAILDILCWRNRISKSKYQLMIQKLDPYKLIKKVKKDSQYIELCVNYNKREFQPCTFIEFMQLVEENKHLEELFETRSIGFFIVKLFKFDKDI